MFDLKILEENEIKKLSNEEYVERLDRILYNIFEEKHGKSYVNHISKLNKDYGQLPPYPQISEIYNSELIKNLENSLQRKIIDNSFKFLIHLEIGFFIPKIKKDSITDILNQISTQKKSAIFLRTAGEYFFNILHLIHKKIDIKEKNNSKTKPFREFIKENGNPFGYFAILLGDIIYFDKNYRSPEVHIGSRLIKHLVSLKGITYTEADEINAFYNLLNNSYKDLVKILNSEVDSMFTGSYGFFNREERKKYFKLYFIEKNEEKFLDYVNKLEKKLL